MLFIDVLLSVLPYFFFFLFVILPDLLSKNVFPTTFFTFFQ